MLSAAWPKEDAARRPHSGVLGIAPIDGAPEAAHQRGHLGPDRELAAGAGLHQPDAFDADDLRGFGPFAPAHMHFGVVDAERLDRDDDITGLVEVPKRAAHRPPVDRAPGAEAVSGIVDAVSVVVLGHAPQQPFLSQPSGTEHRVRHRELLPGL